MASDDEEWTYSIDEVGEDAEDDGLLAGSEDEETSEGGGERSASRRIEPESMNAENVAFVVLGVLIAVGTIAYGLGVI